MQKIPERSERTLAIIMDGEFARNALIKPQKNLQSRLPPCPCSSTINLHINHWGGEKKTWLAGAALLTVCALKHTQMRAHVKTHAYKPHYKKKNKQEAKQEEDPDWIKEWKVGLSWRFSSFLLKWGLVPISISNWSEVGGPCFLPLGLLGLE